MEAAQNTFTTPLEEETTDYLIERASVAIGRLDAQLSASSVAPIWRLRASWTGYAKALRLQGVEIDDIDAFSWGSGVAVPGRSRLLTNIDHFAAFAPWRDRLGHTGRHWAEDLPFTVKRDSHRSRIPILRQALDLQADFLRADPSIAAWLVLPVFLYRLGLTETPLPCLVSGDRRLLFPVRERDRGPVMRRILRSLEGSAIDGRQSLKMIEDTHALNSAAVMGERRTTSLRRLVGLLTVAPVQSPESVARRLKLTLSGAGKLLSRAATLGLVMEISGRRAWRVYVVPDLAMALGFATRPRGRPRSRPTLFPASADMTSILESFDQEMAAFEARFP